MIFCLVNIFLHTLVLCKVYQVCSSFSSLPFCWINSINKHIKWFPYFFKHTLPSLYIHMYTCHSPKEKLSAFASTNVVFFKNIGMNLLRYKRHISIIVCICDLLAEVLGQIMQDPVKSLLKSFLYCFAFFFFYLLPNDFIIATHNEIMFPLPQIFWYMHVGCSYRT